MDHFLVTQMCTKLQECALSHRIKLHFSHWAVAVVLFPSNDFDFAEIISNLVRRCSNDRENYSLPFFAESNNNFSLFLTPDI